MVPECPPPPGPWVRRLLGEHHALPPLQRLPATTNLGMHLHTIPGILRITGASVLQTARHKGGVRNKTPHPSAEHGRPPAALGDRGLRVKSLPTVCPRCAVTNKLADSASQNTLTSTACTSKVKDVGSMAPVALFSSALLLSRRSASWHLSLPPSPILKSRPGQPFPRTRPATPPAKPAYLPCKRKGDAARPEHRRRSRNPKTSQTRSKPKQKTEELIPTNPNPPGRAGVRARAAKKAVAKRQLSSQVGG
jgi:hypothetical protein